jgi:hypothetical protein
MTSDRSQRTLTNAAGQAILTADQAARRAAMAQSPSLLFANLGMDLIDGLVQGLETGKKKLSDKGKAVIADAFTALRNEIDSAESLGQRITDGIFANLNLDDALSKAKETGANIVDVFVEQSKRAGQFAEKLKLLLEAGLNPKTWQEVASKSADVGIQIADAYLKGNTAEMIRRTNDAVNSALVMSQAVGKQAAAAFSLEGARSAAAYLTRMIEEFLPSGKSRKKLLDLIDDLVSAMSRTATISVNASVNGAAVPVSTSSGGGGGGGGGSSSGGGGYTTQQEYQMGAVGGGGGTSSNWVGAAATPSVGSQFSSQTLANAQALNAAAAGGTAAIQALGFTAAEWEDLKRLEAANNAAAGRALGGWVNRNTPYWVGERGPELVTFDRPAYVNSNRRSMGLGGSTYNISVQAGVGDPRAIGKAVVEAITRFEQANGPVYAKAS